MTEPWTTLKLIPWTTIYFEKKGIPNPRLDAELLLAHVLKCPRIDLYTGHEKTIPAKELAQFKSLIERRGKREPLQYIVGETEFWGLKIAVTPDVLIPRPETELLVEEGIKQLITSEKGVGILEIGTGSGCLAVALAKNLPKAMIIATDASKEALGVAHRNAVAHQVADRVSFFQADLAPWDLFRKKKLLLNLIVSNPPYIATGEFASLQPEVRDFEPRRALDGGADGLDLIRRILKEAPSFLKPKGALLVEIGETQGEAVRKIAQGRKDLRFKEIRKDLSGKDRFLVCGK